MRRKSHVMALTAALVVVPAAASAYVLPADAILGLAAYRRARIGFKTLVAEGIHEKDGKRTPVWEAIQAGRAHRRELQGNDATEVLLTVDTRRWRFQKGQTPSSAERRPSDVILSFLGRPEKDPGGKRGILFLKRHKIDEETVSLGRLGHRVAYIIGAKPWEQKKPQLWLDKTLLVPLRLIHKAEDGALMDVQLHGYGSGATSEWYPRKIEVRRNGDLVETLTYNSVELNETVDEALFAPPS